MLILTISAWGLIAPESLVAFVASWPSDTRLYVAAGTRLVIGLIFIAGASKCRLPAVVYGVGICRSSSWWASRVSMRWSVGGRNSRRSPSAPGAVSQVFAERAYR